MDWVTRGLRCLCFGKNICIILEVNANSTLLDHVIRMYLVFIFLCNIGQGNRLLLPIGWKSCKFHATFSNHWPILCCLVIVRHHQQSNQLWSLGNYNILHISNGCKNRQRHISYMWYFKYWDFFFLNIKLEEPLKNKNLQRHLFRLRSFNFCKTLLR
jgi:hypothetical protein